MFRRFLLCALATTAVAASSAHAEDLSTVRVVYADLDLSNAAGRHALDNRVHAAIRNVCGVADERDLVATMAMNGCRRSALAGAKTQIASIPGRSQYDELALRDTTRIVSPADRVGAR